MGPKSSNQTFPSLLIEILLGLKSPCTNPAPFTKLNEPRMRLNKPDARLLSTGRATLPKVAAYYGIGEVLCPNRNKSRARVWSAQAIICCHFAKCRSPCWKESCIRCVQPHLLEIISMGAWRYEAQQYSNQQLRKCLDEQLRFLFLSSVIFKTSRIS